MWRGESRLRRCDSGWHMCRGESHLRRCDTGWGWCLNDGYWVLRRVGEGSFVKCIQASTHDVHRAVQSG